MEKKIKIKIYTERLEISTVPEFVYASAGLMKNPNRKDDVEKTEMFTEGLMKTDGERIEISYEESKMSGMAGTTTRMIFDTSLMDTLTMMRSGTVKMTMVFKKGLRHDCRYDTGIIPFDLTVTTSYIDNRLLTEGEFFVDYTTELAGSSRAITRLRMKVWDAVEESVKV